MSHSLKKIEFVILISALIWIDLHPHRQVSLQTKKSNNGQQILLLRKLPSWAASWTHQVISYTGTHKCSLENNYFYNYQLQQISSSVIWD